MSDVSATKKLLDGMTLHKFVTVQPEASKTEAGEDLYSVTLSDGSVDRHGDTIDPEGWKLDAYKANPVLLWAHDASQLPLGMTLNLGAKGGKLRGDMKFADHEFAKTVEGMIKQGFLRAVSVGFAPLKYEVSEERSQGDSWFPPLDFKEQELLELSVVPVPANPNALIDAKSKGLNVGLIVDWAKRALDAHEGEGLWVPRSKLAQVVRSFEPAKIYSVPALVPAPVTSDNEITPEQAAEIVRSAVQERRKQLEMQRTGKLD